MTILQRLRTYGDFFGTLYAIFASVLYVCCVLIITIIIFRGMCWIRCLRKDSPDSKSLMELWRKTWILLAANIVFILNALATVAIPTNLDAISGITVRLYVSQVLVMLIVGLLWGFIQNYAFIHGNPIASYRKALSTGDTGTNKTPMELPKESRSTSSTKSWHPEKSEQVTTPK